MSQPRTKHDTDKRAVFFLGAAVVCVLLLPITPEKYLLVGVVLAVVYLGLAIASWLDFRSRTIHQPGHDPASRRT